LLPVPDRIALNAETLFAPSLVARFGQQFLVLMLAHLLSSFLDHTAQ
jgi:hypothetical protein